MKSFTFTVPGYAQPWIRQGAAGKFRWSDSNKMKEHKGRIAVVAREVMRGKPLMSGPVFLEINIYRKTLKAWGARISARAYSGELRPCTKPDAENQGKLICDALNGIIWKDDAQICDIHIKKFYGIPEQTEIKVESWD